MPFGLIGSAVRGLSSLVSKHSEATPEAEPQAGFGSDLFDAVKKGTASAVEGIPGQAMHGLIGGRFAGDAQKAYMDRAYPGTNPEQRLGGSTGSAGAAMANPAVQSARISAEAQKYVADKQTEVAREKWKSEKKYIDQQQKLSVQSMATKIRTEGLLQKIHGLTAKEKEILQPHLVDNIMAEIHRNRFGSLSSAVASAVESSGVNMSRGALGEVITGIMDIVAQFMANTKYGMTKGPGSLNPESSYPWPPPGEFLGDGVVRKRFKKDDR